MTSRTSQHLAAFRLLVSLLALLVPAIAQAKQATIALTFDDLPALTILNNQPYVNYLNEMILRMMILKIHPKLVETMLGLAKGEHAAALHNMQEEPAAEDGVPADLNLEDGHGRRGKR